MHHHAPAARVLSLVLSPVLALALALPAVAQHDPAAPAGPAAAAAPPPPTGFTADLLGDYSGAARRLLQLAEAMPAEAYGWRPAAGVRSFAEVLMHVAAGNYLGAASLGMPAPAGVDPLKLETITDRRQAIDTLAASIEHFRTAAAAVDPASLDEQVELFGGRMGKRRLMLLMQGHAHEHMGQAIAYARMNGVVPPWNRGDGG